MAITRSNVFDRNGMLVIRDQLEPQQIVSQLALVSDQVRRLGLECKIVSLIEASVIVANSLSANWQGG